MTVYCFNPICHLAIRLKLFQPLYISSTACSMNLTNIYPCEKLNQHPLDYKMLKAFGCASFPHLVSYNEHKLMPTFIKCVFIGYDLHHEGY